MSIRTKEQKEKAVKLFTEIFEKAPSLLEDYIICCCNISDRRRKTLILKESGLYCISAEDIYDDMTFSIHSEFLRTETSQEKLEELDFWSIICGYGLSIPQLEDHLQKLS